jgi:4-amino-4-deoxy-L-arabinose transferase-like glycosyltransferase
VISLFDFTVFIAYNLTMIMAHWKKWISYILVLLCCAAYIFFRLSVGDTYAHPDEIVPLKIIDNIFITGCWDTNWALADLPPWFKSDQYTFSSYILTSAVMIKFMYSVPHILTPDTNFIIVLRLYSALFHVITILLTYAVGKSLFDSRRIGIVAAWLAAVFPLLFQDSLYARPESFTAMFTLLLVLLLARQRQNPKIPWFFIIGGLIGFLVATKITFLVLLALPCILGFRRRNRSRWFYIQLTVILAIGAVGGFVLGAPYALVNWSSYLHGLTFLFSRYAEGHRPYGLPDGNIPERLAYSWHYFSAIGAGLFILLAVAGWLLLLKKKLYDVFLAIGLFFFVIVYFSTKSAFFERNFSFAIPFLSMCVGLAIFWCIDRIRSTQIIRIALSGIIVAAVCGPLLLFLWKFETKVLSGQYEKQHQELRTKLQNQYGGLVKSLGFCLDDFNRYDPSNIEISGDRQDTVYEICGANDKYTRNFIALACRDLGLRVIAQLPSPFQANGLPPSTLYTYHAPEYFYLTHISNTSGSLH